MRSLKKLIPVVLIAVGALLASDRLAPDVGLWEGTNDGDQVLADAFRDRKSDLQVEGSGAVVAILPDDNDGSRHQRFILELDSGQTLLVAHNIDLAPRIVSLKRGDRVAFNGEFEWSPKGGVIHWTHHDPQRRHASGWLRHEGRIYE